MGYTMRTERYRFVEWQNWKTKAVVARELYNLRDDPYEMKNIAGKAESSSVVTRLAKRLSKGWKAALPNNLK